MALIPRVTTFELLIATLSWAPKFAIYQRNLDTAALTALEHALQSSGVSATWTRTTRKFYLTAIPNARR